MYPFNAQLHDNTARVLLLGLSVKHLARGGQVVALGDERIHLLAALEGGLDALVQYPLRLVELFLNRGHGVDLLGDLGLFDQIVEIQTRCLERPHSGEVPRPRVLRKTSRVLLEITAHEFCGGHVCVLLRSDDDADERVAVYGVGLRELCVDHVVVEIVCFSLIFLVLDLMDLVGRVEDLALLACTEDDVDTDFGRSVGVSVWLVVLLTSCDEPRGGDVRSSGPS